MTEPKRLTSYDLKELRELAGPPVDWDDGERCQVQELLPKLLNAYYEYENAITWNTSCLGCSGQFDQKYERDMQREALLKVRAVIEDPEAAGVAPGDSTSLRSKLDGILTEYRL